MALSFVDVLLLTTIFITQKHASARLFTADCTKKPAGQFLCATNTPNATVTPLQGMPGHHGCTMSCTLDERCLHFNHVMSTWRPPSCQLFYDKPINFNVMNGCEHYHALSAGESRNFHKFQEITNYMQLENCIGTLSEVVSIVTQQFCLICFIERTNMSSQKEQWKNIGIEWAGVYNKDKCEKRF